MPHRKRIRILRLCLAVVLALFAAGIAGLSAACAAPSAPESTLAPFYLSDSEPVYVTATGKCYHSVDDCGTTKTAFLLSLAEACRLGYRSCGRCDPSKPVTCEAPAFPSDAVIVYITVGNACYHRTPRCSGLKKTVAVPLEEALYLGREPCDRCGPPTQP